MIKGNHQCLNPGSGSEGEEKLTFCPHRFPVTSDVTVDCNIVFLRGLTFNFLDALHRHASFCCGCGAKSLIQVKNPQKAAKTGTPALAPALSRATDAIMPGSLYFQAASSGDWTSIQQLEPETSIGPRDIHPVCYVSVARKVKPVLILKAGVEE
jgi:hypothetical protein